MSFLLRMLALEVMKGMSAVMCCLLFAAGCPWHAFAQAAGGSAGAEEEAPMTALELFQAGQAAYEAQDFPGAREHFSRFLEVYGEMEEAAEAVSVVRPLLALSLVRMRSFDEALQAIDAALVRPAPDAELTGDSAVVGEVSEDLRRELLFWKGVCHLQGQAYRAAQEAFGDYFAGAEEADPRRMEAVILFGTVYLLQGDHEEAAVFFERRLKEAREGQTSETAARMMGLRLHALLASGDLDAALDLTMEAASRFHEFSQIMALQAMILDLGSRLLEASRSHDALRCLHQVWPRHRLLTLQKERRERLERRLRSARTRPAADALVFQLEGILSRITREEEHFVTLEHYDVALRLRLASAYLRLNRYREAALIVEERLEDGDPAEAPLLEESAVSVISCWMQEEHWERAAAAADRYLAIFDEKGSHASRVHFLKGEAWHGGQRYAEALPAFRACVAEDPDGPLVRRALFMQAICHLQCEEHSEAITLLRQVASMKPTKGEAKDSTEAGSLKESARYWEGMAHSFAGDHREAIACLEKLLKAFPTGRYVGDAVFRKAFCRHAMAEGKAAIAGFRAFLRDHPHNGYVDEARLLLGDALLAEGSLEEGLSCYADISEEATRFFEEGLFKRAQALKLAERFSEMETLLQEFASDHAESLRLPEAIHWLAWLQNRAGDLEGARRRYWEALDRWGDDEDKPAVLDLATGVQRLYTGDDRKTLLKEWQERRTRAQKEKRSTYAVRCRWAHARTLRHTLPVQASTLLADLLPEVIPQRHSPKVIGDVAEALESLQAYKEASQLHAELIKWHPLSLERDLAEAALGRQAIRAGDYQEAWDHFQELQKRQSPVVPRGEILLGLAECEKALLRDDDAMNTVLSLLKERSVSSASKAKGLLLAGSWLAEEGKRKESLVFFERIYLGYGRYADLVAAAYWQRGQILEVLGEREKAIETYRELLSRENLKSYPEYAWARARLET